MRVLFVAALSVVLLSTPAAAGIKAYCEEMRALFAPFFEQRTYEIKLELIKIKKDQADKTCDKKYEEDLDKHADCYEKARKKTYPEPEKPKLSGLDQHILKQFSGRRPAQKFLEKMAALYDPYCKKF